MALVLNPLPCSMANKLKYILKSVVAEAIYYNLFLTGTYLVILLSAWFFAEYPFFAAFFILVASILYIRRLPFILAWPTIKAKHLLRDFILFVSSIVLAFALLFWSSGDLRDTIDQSLSFWDALYFSINTWTTFGGSEIVASPNLRWIASLEAIFGLFSLSLGTAVLWLWCERKIASHQSYIDYLRAFEPSTVQEWYDKAYLTGGRVGLPPGGYPARVDQTGTKLYQAAERGELEAVRAQLAGNKEQLNVPNSEGWTPLMIASAQGHPIVVKLLLDQGSNPNFSNRHGRTPLMYASMHGHLGIVQLLVAAGAKLNQVDPAFGHTALATAALAGHDKVVNFLLSSGADPAVPNSVGETALDLARKQGHHNVCKILEA